ncbi:hypothetical protein K60_027720 [Mycobacterium tuberculosis variant bovis BCG str. Korea 1168P]|nr:hypothetical protein K60_027720 [Mycobacterium tuberculosis variant bovis BCG str. Korea 1168P]EFO74016.1 hypothetical protein TMAG_03067 [Mycobacterium tuberculosis SUMu001]EFP34964.1 hypothetical protein TMGG_02189 [Mycobacterium tuberculosis SUMu007]CDM11066.1 hypothetical PROTEIN MT49_2929 [Mycobacterium tuberculosis 49-02]
MHTCRRIGLPSKSVTSAGDDAERSDEEERRLTSAGDDAERSDEEERRLTSAGDDAERSDEEERRLTSAGDDAERSDEEERRLTSAGDDAERSDEEERRLTSAEPALFREAVAAMNAVTVRPEIELGPIRPPQRLAPYSYALGAEIKHPELDVIPERSEGDAFGRLIMLYDPDGSDAWDGTIRLVAYVQADLDSSEAVDPLLPEVAWSWLVDALTARTDQVRALGGTVTATTSVRYGDISGPPRAHQLELRASWTATTPDLGAHVQAFCDVLEHAAGLPPAGVTDLGSRSRA